jgi:hypothetical protein
MCTYVVLIEGVDVSFYDLQAQIVVAAKRTIVVSTGAPDLLNLISSRFTHETSIRLNKFVLFLVFSYITTFITRLYLILIIDTTENTRRRLCRVSHSAKKILC